MRPGRAVMTTLARGRLPGLKPAPGPADHPQVDADQARDGAVERAASPRRVRIYHSIRTANLERFRTMTPAAVLYVHRRYDFDPAMAEQAPHVRRLGRLATVVHLLRTEYDAVELNEPLALARWADLAAQITAVRLRDAVHRRRTTIGAYCIGLSDPVERLTARRPVPTALARRWTRLVLGFLVRGTDRLAMGTDGTLTLLGRYVAADVLAPRVRLFPAVPAPCGCPPAARSAGTVVFVGAFAERKGIRQLMGAWERLPADAGLRLRLLGKGRLLEEVRAWTAGRPDVDLVVDPPRDEIHATLRAAHVLVLLSQRAGAWREQVGLPIVEGLAHGCEIVTTDETGLAPWLDEHGHQVVPAAASSAEVATAIRHAAASTRSADQVCADLPEEDTRWAADRWLLTDVEA
jgi:glycosyltransferase involved in cell wall biosynthesis